MMARGKSRTIDRKSQLKFAPNHHTNVFGVELAAWEPYPIARTTATQHKRNSSVALQYVLLSLSFGKD